MPLRSFAKLRFIQQIYSPSKTKKVTQEDGAIYSVLYMEILHLINAIYTKPKSNPHKLELSTQLHFYLLSFFAYPIII